MNCKRMRRPPQAAGRGRPGPSAVSLGTIRAMQLQRDAGCARAATRPVGQRRDFPTAASANDAWRHRLPAVV